MRTDSSIAEPVKFGKYDLIGRLGEGGMCHVFRARSRDDGHEVAIKLLKETHRNEDRVLDLFITEADLSLMLNHPNLINTIEAGEIKGRYFIAMELIEGVTLEDLIKQVQNLGLSLPPDFGLFIMHQVLEGLNSLHNFTGISGRELDLVHRDVTPSNIFICFDGRVILGDFGVAHIRAYGGIDSSVTIGKLGYLSPESVVGDDIDHRSDLFSVGIILWELLCGSRLYTGEKESEIMNAIAEASVPDLTQIRPGLSNTLVETIKKSLARKPQSRFDSALELSYALRPEWSTELASQESIKALLAGLFRDDFQRWAAKQDHETVASII